MLAEITLDMASIGAMLKNSLMVVLAIVGFFMFGIPLIVGKLKSMLKPAVPAPPAVAGPGPFQHLNDILDRKIEAANRVTTLATPEAPEVVMRSSDQKPPAGFAEHMQIIQESAPNAGPSIWWEYALKGLTSAEVSRAEAKLARLDGNVEAGKSYAPLVENEA